MTIDRGKTRAELFATAALLTGESKAMVAEFAEACAVAEPHRRDHGISPAPATGRAARSRVKRRRRRVSRNSLT